MAIVSRRNPDGSARKPGMGDRVCLEHFISQKMSDLPESPDFVPSVQHRKSQQSSNNASYRRFEHI